MTLVHRLLCRPHPGDDLATLPLWLVTLHRAQWDPEAERHQLLSSWQPIPVRGIQSDAERTAQDLLAQNRWGGPVDYPVVTITEPGPEPREWVFP